MTKTPTEVLALAASKLHQLIRQSGGIVHGDGNIFFTNAEQFMAAVWLAQPSPEGWKLVPIDATGEMWSASRREFIKYANKYEDATSADAASVWADVAGPDIYRAMLAAAPSLPPQLK